jgi:hypothetical protein
LLCDDVVHSFPKENPLYLSRLSFVFWLGCKNSPPKKPWLVRWNQISPKLSFMHPQLSHNVNPVDVVVVLWMLAHSGPLGLWLTHRLFFWVLKKRNEKWKTKKKWGDFRWVFNHQKWDNKGQKYSPVICIYLVLKCVAINIEGWLKPSWIENKIPGSTEQRVSDLGYGHLLAMAINSPGSIFVHWKQVLNAFACLQSNHFPQIPHSPNVCKWFTSFWIPL